MSNVNILFCQNHSKRKAYRYCEECNEFICNACAFQEKHLNHIEKIKSFSDTLKNSFPKIESLNISSIPKYIELFHYIINYNSSFMSFDLNNIINQINEKFDQYINKLIDLKVKFKILISQKFDLINTIFSENENKVLETQNKLIFLLNDEQSQYFERLNTCLEELRMNKNEKNMISFIEKYSKLVKEAFDDESDFNMKYNLYMAQKEVEKNNKLIKENILDKLVQPCLNEAVKNIDNMYQKINNQNNKDLDSLKKKFDYLIKNPNKNDIEDEENDEKIQIKTKPVKIEEKKPENNTNNKLNTNPFKVELKKVMKEEPKKVVKEEPKKVVKEEPKKVVKEEPKKIIKEEPKKIIKEEPKKETPKPKMELLEIEFEPPDIESNQFTQKELDEIGNELDDDYENEFLRIEEDGDDGLLLAEIIDGNDSEEATVNLEEFFINNMDDKLDIQYYEGIKFEGENGGEGLNDEAMVEAIEDDNKEEPQKEELPKEEPKKEDIIKEEIKKEEIKKEEIKKEEIKKEEPKMEVKKENKVEPPKKMNAIEEIKMKMFANKQGFNPQQMLKPIPTSSNTENPPGKIPGKLNTEFMNKFQNKFGGGLKMPQPQKKPETKEPQTIKKDIINPNDNNIAQFIEDKNEQEENNNNENNNEEIKEDEEPIITNTNEKDKLKVLCNIVKKGGRNKLGFQSLFKELSWEERGKVEIMAINQKNNSIHIYNELSNKIEEIKVDQKFPLHLNYINLPPYLYISGGKVSGKDSNSFQRIQRIGQNEVKIEEIAKLNQGRSCHCTIYVQTINSLFFISGSRIKSCEKYSFNKEKIESFPGLRVSREKCCACLLNEKYLYVFFGFDRTKNKFETSIEKIFINDAMSWETINISANQNILKKQNFSCIPYEKEDKKGAIIVGGINSLRNETKETVFVNIETNKADLFNQLPVNSSFTNSHFLNFGNYSCYNEMINFSNEFNIIRFNMDDNNFYGS